MENNVQKPTSTNYLTKLTLLASPSPSRDHQHHLNQQNPSTTARENKLQLVADFEQKITAEEEMQQYEDKHYAVDDAAEDKEILTTDEFLRLFGSDVLSITKIRPKTTITTSTNVITETQRIIDTTTTTTITSPIANLPMKMKIRPNTTNTTDTATSTNDSPAVDKSHVDTPIHTDTPNNTIEEAEDLEQTEASDRAQQRELITNPSATTSIDTDTPIIEEDSTNLQSLIEIPINTDGKFTATTTTTTEEEEEEVSTTSEEKSGTPTTTGIEEKEVRNMNDDAIIEDKFTTSTTTDIPNIIENTTTVYITNTVHTTDTTDTNKVIETPILSPSPTSNNYYDNIDNKILRTEYEGTIVFEQLLGTNHCLHGYSQQYYYRRLIN